MLAPRLKLLLPVPHLGPLDYAWPDALGPAPPIGSFVAAPLGPRTLTGVVWEGAADTGLPDAKLRAVAGVLGHVPPLAPALRQLITWVAGYYLQPIGAVLRMAMSVADALAPPRPERHYRLTGHRPNSLTPKRQAALAALAGAQGPLAELARQAGVSAAVVKGLLEAGCLEPVSVVAEPAFAAPDPGHAQPALSAEQVTAAAALRQAVAARTFEALLLDGVTGSGKTEVYFEAIARALEAGGQVLVLLPEIAMTRQWFARFEARFGAPPVEWHSELGSAHRRDAWRAVAAGRARVVVGARSALFLPFRDLALIVVDEEHEASFKQEDGVPYQARDMAVVRASLERIPVVLASATPSLESHVNADQQRYRRLRLPARFGSATLPAVRAIDLKQAGPPRGRWLAPALVNAVSETLAAGEQALLFLNRRGYAPVTLCRACGTRVTCPRCSAWLVEHRLAGRLQCHHCGYSSAIPSTCSACGAQDSLVPCGPGVERIAEEVAAVLPEARIAIATSDTIPTKARAQALVEAVETGAVNLLVGTQILTKGHHFPNLTLVGIVDGDLGLAGGDLRAAERTFQQITQAAGRAGRAHKPGQVWLQTHQPENPVMQALVSDDAAGFYGAEVAARQSAGLPPFGRMAGVIVSGPREDEVLGVARALGRAAPSQAGLQVLGPAPAPMALLRGQHRQRLLVLAQRSLALQPILRAWLAAISVPRSVQVRLDVDPYNFL
jgi:primosomal protein N' (replication factor Y)